MTSSEIRQRFLDFFAKRGHAVLPSASLVPKNDPSVLFNTAGMQPLVPYLLGEKHPQGNRLASCQKCVRTGDIDEVGDSRHLTFFEMLGNWSLGDYFKEDAIKWSYEFLTSKEEGLGLDPSRLYITVFEGDNIAPRDMEAVGIWKQYMPEGRIYFLPAKNNWWSPGDNGPCGPDTEMFYDVTPHGLGDLTHDQFVEADDRGDVVEIWNDVFMQYEKQNGEIIRGKTVQNNVDTGSGLERVAMVVQGKSNVYETDMFAPIINEIKTIVDRWHREYDHHIARIIADHIRTSVFLITDGVLPSNKDQGYILRRLLRRAIRYADQLGLSQGKETTKSDLSHLAEIVINIYAGSPYSFELGKNANLIFDEIEKEEKKFRKTLHQGLKEFEKIIEVSINRSLESVILQPNAVFRLVTTYGFPIELILEEAKKRGYEVDMVSFEKAMAEHKNLSSLGAEQKFKGGLANTSDMTVKLHTAHHLLLAALQKVLGAEVHQRGSNITEERLRIDFSFDRKMTDEEKKAVEDQVNEWIQTNHKVCRREMPRTEAEQIGAEMEFGAKYPDTVSVYFIEDEKGNAISKEFCGGPHAEETSTLGTFHIQKEEAVASGIRRIKAILE